MMGEYKKGIEKAKKIVVARVNGVDITMKELTDIMKAIAPRYINDATKKSPEIDAKIRKEALDTLVFRELAFQEAIRQGMKVKSGNVETAMKNIKTNLGSESAYKEYLVNSGHTEESLRKQLERDQLIDMINTKEVLQKTKVDEKLVRNTYNKDKASFVVPETFFVEDVIIQIIKGDEAAAMKMAQETFSILKKNNNDTSKLPQDKRRVIRSGNFTKQEYPDLFQAAAKMKAGDLSNAIKESDGLHIIKLLKKEPSRQLSFEEARADIAHKLLLPDINKRRQQWENELKKNARIEIMNTQDALPAPKSSRPS
jgi:parvulin-like peptidyl-prolyl isomerase